MAGTILAGNEDGRFNGQPDYSPDCYSLQTYNFTSERSNLVGILTSNCSFRDAIWGTPDFGNQIGTGAAPLDAKLGALDSTFHGFVPTLTSPAVDKATSVSSSPLSTCPADDQRLRVRPADGDSNGTVACDIGSMERNASSV
jgi:hypothetical protein